MTTHRAIARHLFGQTGSELQGAHRRVAVACEPGERAQSFERCLDKAGNESAVRSSGAPVPPSRLVSDGGRRIRTTSR